MRACWLAVAIASGVLQAQSPFPDASSPGLLRNQNPSDSREQLLRLPHGFRARAACGSTAGKRMLKGGWRGPAMVPGDPDNSLLIKAVQQTDASSRCRWAAS